MNATWVSLDTWYTFEIYYPEELWYAVGVIPGLIYNIFWDDSFQGSGSYDGDIIVQVFMEDGVTSYTGGTYDSGFIYPLIIMPVESSILIQIQPYSSAGADGSFAFGAMME